MNNYFKTKYIPISAFIFAIIAAIFILIFTLTYFMLFKNDDDISITENIAYCFSLLIDIVFITLSLKELIKATKNYRIDKSGIEQFNFLNMRRKIVQKSNIKGFSSSYVHLGEFKFKRITIYTNDGSHFTLEQFTYGNFKKIFNALIEHNYQFLGTEKTKLKWGFIRIYKYDEIMD